MTASARARRALRLGLGLVWLLLVGFGFLGLLRFEVRPGPGSLLESWPGGLELDPARPTLLVFVHPRCPCSRATIAELDRLATRIQGRARIQVIVYDEPALGPEWARGAMEAAQRIPGASVTLDPRGGLARRFRCATSGETFLFAPGGRLLFAGGLTDSRGHEGDSAGRADILGLLDDPARGPLATPVYGCPLLEATQASLAGGGS